jgi:hypothetical protein
MAVNGHDLNSVHAEYGLGTNMNAYLSRTYWYGPVPGASSTFPASNLSLNSMYATSPNNDWPATDCGGNCVK